MREFIKDWPIPSIILGFIALICLYFGMGYINTGGFFSGLVIGSLGAIGTLLVVGGFYFLWLKHYLSKPENQKKSKPKKNK